MVRNSGNPRINRLRRFLFIFAMVILSTNVRYGRGLILNLEGKVKKRSGHRYEVNGYDVTYKNGHWQCSCPDHKHRRGPCKHIYATGQVKAPIRFMAGLAAYLGPAWPMLSQMPFPGCGKERKPYIKGRNQEADIPVQMRASFRVASRIREEAV